MRKIDSKNLDYLKYLGVPFKFAGNSIEEGFDCINLCCAVAKDRGILMPNINHQRYNLDTHHLKMIEVKNMKNMWEKVEPQPNVLVVFKINGLIRHVGFMLDDLQFIHIMEKSKVTVEKINSLQWSKRVEGFYKYIGNVQHID
jgi:cell wall-associated NlpC family hydrolase